MIDGVNNTARVGTSVHRSVVAVNIGDQFEASTGSRKHIFFVDKFKETQKVTSFTGVLRFVDVAKEDTQLVSVNSTKGKGQQCYTHLLTLQPLISLEIIQRSSAHCLYNGRSNKLSWNKNVLSVPKKWKGNDVYQTG